MAYNRVDIKENYILKLDKELLELLLKDRSSKKNIIWATDDYSYRGAGYQTSDQITIRSITGRNGNVIRPRAEKEKKEQETRIKKKAEVFTPSWVCNAQNNLVDNAWFGSDNIFNVESDKSWTATEGTIHFPSITKKTWKDYIYETRMEMTCGEAPYLVSRYDVVSGKPIRLSQRIGLLDRKLRVVNENTQTEEDWLKWAAKAYQNIYGFDCQGDNVLLARENLLFTFIDYYTARFEKEPEIMQLRKIAEILSWNIWQMDGLNFIVPNSCRPDETQLSLFEPKTDVRGCPGCRKNDPYAHTGIYCIIKDWKKKKNVKFVSMLNND